MRYWHSTKLLTALAWLACASSARSAGMDAPFKYEVISVAPGVYAFVEPEMLGIVSGTVVAVVGDESVLVFDTTHHVSSARNIIADLKRITSKPVKFIINSHWHEDHWTGNAEFAKAYPGVTFYAHPFTAQIIEKRRESFRGEHCKQELQPELDPLRKELASGKRSDGAAISAAGLKVRQRLVDQDRGDVRGIMPQAQNKGPDQGGE